MAVNLGGDGLRALATLIGDGVIVTDAELDRPGPRITYANDAITRITGWPKEDLIGLTPRVFQGPSTDSAELARIRQALRDAEPIRTTLVNRHHDGHDVIVELDIAPIRMPDGTLSGFLGIQRDVTDRHRADAALRAAIESTSELFTINDASGRVTYVSPSITTVLGWQVEEIVGRLGADFVHPDDARRIASGFQHKATQEGRNAAVQFRFRHADGTWRWLEAVTTNLLHDPAVAGMVVNARDVTDRKFLEDELHTRLKLEAIGRLASGIAHDFNNMLTVIGAHCELALSALADDAKARVDLEAIGVATERSRMLTRQLLLMGRGIENTPQAMDVNAAVGATMNVLRPLLTNVDVHLALAPEPCTVLIDSDQFEQVLANLVVNAQDAMPPGGGQVRVSTRPITVAPQSGVRGEPNVLTPGQWVEIVVADDGMGIEPEALERIFEPFFSTKDASSGTGLGLSVAHGIVTRAGGHITARSTPGHGTDFTIMLPVLDAAG